MKKILNLLGYLVLSFFTLVLFLQTFINTFAYDGKTIFSILALIIIGLIYGIKTELANYLRLRLWDFNFKRDDFFNFLSVPAGAFLTYILSVLLQLGPVISAGLIGVVFALLKPKYGVPAYCGAFVGMACPCYIYGFLPLLLASTVAGIIYVITTPLFNGFGGKLGTIAFAGCVIAGFSLGCHLQSVPVPGWETGWLILIYSIIAAVVTYYLSIPLKHGAVLASGIVGLAGGLLLPAIYPAAGSTLGIVVICSSFAGMSSPQRFHKTYLMTIAGLFSGIIFMFSLPYMGGAGGKLGTIAFGSVIALRSIIDLATWAIKKTRRQLA